MKTKAKKQPVQKIKTEWNLGLLYKSPKDPQIEKDLTALEKECKNFSNQYRDDSTYLEDPKVLLIVLKEYERVVSQLFHAKPLAYLGLFNAIKSDDDDVNAKLNLLGERQNKAFSLIMFFELKLGKLSDEKKKEFIQSPELSHYHYFLKKIFESSKYDLTEPEEKILNLKSIPGHSLWVSGFERLLNKQTVKLNGKNIPISEATFKMPDLPYKKRKKLHEDMTEVFKSISDFAESEMNAIATNKKIDDELRGFERPYNRTLLASQNSEKEILGLVNVIRANYSISHRFYKIKSKLTKIKKLEWQDRHASVGKIGNKFPFERGINMFKEVLSAINPEYVSMFESMLKNGQIDVYPRKNKSGGAFCASYTYLPTFIMLNHVDSLDSVMTMAHETGHAIHGEYTERNQSPIYQNYTLSSAEVASNLFERFLFESIYETLEDKNKIILLHDNIVDAISSVFVQGAAFNFELEFHNTLREKGFVSKDEIADILVKNMSEMGGSAVKLKRDDGYMFTRWGHLRVFFYNYPYAYGNLVSRTLYKKYKENASYLTQIEKFLSAGGSKSPADIFKDIGIDTTDPKFFEEGLKSIEEDIARLEKLIKKK